MSITTSPVKLTCWPLRFICCSASSGLQKTNNRHRSSIQRSSHPNVLRLKAFFPDSLSQDGVHALTLLFQFTQATYAAMFANSFTLQELTNAWHPAEQTPAP